MRIGTFLMGSVVGAVGAMYIAKKKPAAWSLMTESLSGMKGKAVNQVVNKMSSSATDLFGTGDAKQAGQKSANKASTKQAKKSSSVEDQALLQTIIESDPQLKNEVNEITKQGKTVQH